MLVFPTAVAPSSTTFFETVGAFAEAPEAADAPLSVVECMLVFLL